MKEEVKKGLSFGTTSGIITTLGLIVGLHSGTHSKLVILGGILTIAVADAFSDALGMHISEEAENHHTKKQVWTSTIATFIAKFIFALTFVAPILIFDLFTAIVVSVIWGLFILTILSYYIAKERNSSPLKAIFEHLAIAIIVIVITHYVGDFLALAVG